MELFMQDALTESIIKQAAKLYDISFDTIKSIGGFESFVYEYTKDNEEYILRFTHSAHRDNHQILGEIEFIDYLDQNDATVSTVVHSVNDKLVEVIRIDEEHYFNISVFTKAPGTLVKQEHITDAFWEEFGTDVGRLHKLTKSYKPRHKRVEWHEESFFEMAERVLKDDDIIIKERLLEIKDHLMSLPKTIDNYGLIHTDLHFGNMFIHNGSLTFFDWDDSAYKHFISDIAIIIFYSFWFKENVDQLEIRQILIHFMKGYRKENNVDDDFFQYLNDFLMLRTIVLYVVIHAAGRENIESKFGKFYIDHFRDRIINRVPFLDLELVTKGI